MFATMWGTTLTLHCLLLIWCLHGCFVDAAATLDGCYLVNRTSGVSSTSAGTYDPSALNHETCVQACAYQEYSYAILRAGQYCMCSDTNYPPSDKKTDDSLCNTPCTGDNLASCGHDNYALVYHIVDTRALIQLDKAVTYVVGSSATVSPSSVSGSDLQYSYDFGDGSSATESNSHTYTAPGDYIVSVTVHNDKWVDFDAFAHSVNAELAKVTVTCPIGVGVAEDFECTVEILHGNDLQVTPTFGSGSESVTGPALPAGSPTYSYLGHISQDPDPSLPSSDINGASPIFWVFPGLEVQQASKLVAIELAIASVGDGTLDIVVYKPVCAAPSDVYCPIDNICTTACDYDFTLMTPPAQQQTCTVALDNFCLSSSRCVDGDAVNTCPAKPTRYETNPTGTPRAEYEVVQVEAVNVAGTGYIHQILATPIDLPMGYVVGVKVTTAGAQVSYESTTTGTPVEFQYAGTNYLVGQALPVVSKTSGHQIHHLVRFTLVQPVALIIQHAFDEPNFYAVSASVTGALGGPVQESTVILVQEIITGLVIKVDNDVMLVGDIVTVYARIDGGAMVNYTWDWGDGNQHDTVRQATSFNESDVQTHTYITDGTFALTVTAYNFANNDTATVTVYVQNPIVRDHFVISSDSPRPHPGDITFTVTINLPFGQDLGTAPHFSASITFYENSTLTPLGIGNDGESEPFSQAVRFSGEYQAIVTISNKISMEHYKLMIVMVEPITGFSLDAMYQPPLPPDGPIKVGFTPSNNVFPLDSPVVFVPRFATGTRVQYNINYGDGSSDTVTGETIPHLYSAGGPYSVSIQASNDLPGSFGDSVSITLQENIAGIQVSELQATTANETKDFDVSIASLGTQSCLVIDYGDGFQEIFGDRPTCENHANYPSAIWVRTLATTFRISHRYTMMDSYHLTASGFNLVSDASTDLFFAVSDFSCNSPKLFIRGGHQDWRGPRVTYFTQYIQIQGVTDVKCKSNENRKVWELQEVNPGTGHAIPGTKVTLTDIPPSHQFYLPDADTAEINIPPRTIPVGIWKFTYTVYMNPLPGDAVDYRAFANEYVEVRATPLKIQIIEGQTTSKVVGHGLPVKLQPGVLSRDPDLPDDVMDQNFSSIEYYCRRFYEPWKLDDQREIDKSFKIPLGRDDPGGMDSGGCFGTGNGLLDYEGDILDLDTNHALHNMTYEIMVVITKGSRFGNASVYFTVKPGDPPQSSVSCGGGTLFEAAYASLVVNPTDDFRLKASCESGCSGAVYQWDMDYVNENGTMIKVDGWEQHSTGPATESLFIAKEVFTIFPDEYRYLFTIHITNQFGQSGKAHMRVILNEPPEGGTCTIAPIDVTTDDIVEITCADWEDEHGVSNYEFFVQVHNDESVNKVVGFGRSASVQFYPPMGKVEDGYQVAFGVQIDDSLGATTIYDIGSIKVRPTNLSSSEFLSEENTEKTERQFQRLAAEGNSRAINNVILKESSRLNSIRAAQVNALNGTNGTSEEDSSDDDVLDPRLYEAGRTTRAYWRKNMAELQTQTSLDSLADVLYAASSATVLTEATDELSHDALVSLTSLGEKMVRTLQLMAQDTDQKTVVKTVTAVFEFFSNLLEGSAKTIDDPLWLLDQYEEEGSTGGFSSLNQDIRRELTQSQEESYLTTEDTVSHELKVEKEKKALSVVADVNRLMTQLTDIMKQNKLPREPASKIKTHTGTMTVSRTEASAAVEMAMKEGDGLFDLPNWCALRGQEDCDEDEIVDVQSNSYQNNHFNYMNSSARISEKSNVMALKFEDENGQEISISNSQEEIEIWIPRPNTETPECNSFSQNFNTTSQTGMSMHSIYVPFDQTKVTLQVIPEEFFSVQYSLMVRYLHPPTREDYDLKWIVPHNISMGANVSDYTVELDENFISNNTGVYYLGIVEIPQEPQGDIPGSLFDDKLSPQELLDDILRMHRAFNFTGNYTLCVYISGCAYFDNQTQEWSTAGVRLGPKTTKDITQCFSRHLTSFASTWIVPPTPLDFQYIFNNAGFLENLTIYITTIVIYVLFIFIFIWARRKDRKDIIMQGLTPMADNKPKNKYLYEIVVMTGQWKGSGTNSKVHFILSGEDDETEVRTFEDDKRPILQTGAIDRFVMAVPRPLGTLNYMRVWHDNSGKGAMQSWFVAYLAVRDLQTRQRYYFIANRWFSLVDDDGQVDRLLPVAGREQMQGFSHVFSTHTRKNLNDGHLWFSIFLRPVGSRFTRVQRAACCLMALWLEMLVNIMFYKVVPPAPSSSAINIGPFSMSPAQISIGIQSSLIVFPITLLVVQIFRKARPRRRQKSHHRIIKEQQEELKKKYRIGKEDVISQSHVTIENTSRNADDAISTRSEANLLDNQTDNPMAAINTTTSKPPQKTSQKKKKFALPWWSIIIGWILCLASIAAASTFTVFYGIQFGDRTTKEWLASLVVTFITGILCTQPIKILLVAMFIALIIKSPNADEEDGLEEEEDEDAELGKDEMWLHDISSSSQRKTAYKPPDPANLERIREQRIKELKMYNILREICFYIVFLWTLMVFSYSSIDPFAFYVKDQYVNTLNNADGINTFDKVTGVKSFWRWVETGLVPNLYAGPWYNGELDPYQAGFFGDRQSYILGKVVMRQVRVKEGLCEVHDEFQETIAECNEAYSFFNEDTEDYGRAWRDVNDTDEVAESYRYTSADDLNGYPFLGIHALYGGGGYVVVVDGSQNEMLAKFQRLYNETWINKYTRAVFVEFSCYNPQVNLFAVVNLVTEFLQTGAGETMHRIDIIRLLTYSEGFGVVRIMCEVMFFCFILFFIVKEIRNARREKRQYLKNFWNWVEVAIIGFSIGSAVIYFYRMYITNGILETLKEGAYRYIKLQYVAYWNELLGYMLGWIVFLATLKFLKLLRFNRRIGVLSSTIRNCSTDLLYFGIMFCIVFFAFATAFYLIFSSTVYTYSDFIYTCESLISSILGKFRFHELIVAEGFLGPFFFFSFMTSMSYILINMFLTIINEAFKVVNADISKQSNEYEMVDFMIRRLKMWTGLGKPPVMGGDKKPGDGGDEDDGLKKEPDIMDEFPEKVDQLLNSIAKIYFNHEKFDEVIRGMGHGKKGKSTKKTISV